MWVKLDDEFPDHSKLATLGVHTPLCGWLFLCGLAWCNRQLTDGWIPKVKIYSLASFVGLEFDPHHAVKGRLAAPVHAVDVQELAALLVQCGLWEDEGRHYYVHDYLDYQPSRAEVLAKVEADRARKKQNHRRNGGSHGVTPTGIRPESARNPTPPVPVPVPKDQDQDLPRAGEQPLPPIVRVTGKNKYQPSTKGAWSCSHIPPCRSTIKCRDKTLAEVKAEG